MSYSEGACSKKTCKARPDDIDATPVRQAEQCVEVHGGDVASAEVLEAFRRNVANIEAVAWITDRQQLQAAGVMLPPPAELADTQVAAKLDEIFITLAVRNTYITNTDHLSDRELYERLWGDTLDEQHPPMSPTGVQSVWTVDMVGSGSEADIADFLRYYADEPTRRQWRRDWPDDHIPPHEPPPYDRDRHLPKPPHMD